jgi:hypothetical protein
MNKPLPTDPSAALAALADDYASKSKAALFRAHFDGIERALQSGAPRSRVVEILKTHGIGLSVASFNEYLYRERKRRRKAMTPTAPAPAPAPIHRGPEVMSDEQLPTATEPFKRSDPRAIDAIINSTPDLESLAKIHREQSRKV